MVTLTVTIIEPSMSCRMIKKAPWTAISRFFLFSLPAWVSGTVSSSRLAASAFRGFLLQHFHELIMQTPIIFSIRPPMPTYSTISMLSSFSGSMNLSTIYVKRKNDEEIRKLPLKNAPRASLRFQPKVMRGLASRLPIMIVVNPTVSPIASEIRLNESAMSDKQFPMTPTDSSTIMYVMLRTIIHNIRICRGSSLIFYPLEHVATQHGFPQHGIMHGVGGYPNRHNTPSLVWRFFQHEFICRTTHSRLCCTLNFHADFIALNAVDMPYLLFDDFPVMLRDMAVYVDHAITVRHLEANPREGDDVLHWFL